MNRFPIIQDLLTFLDASPTAWHAVDEIKKRLEPAGFLELNEKERWEIEPEKIYYVTRNQSSLCAFILPKQLPKNLRLLASHTDSPSLKLKPQAEFRKNQMILLGLEIYGAPLLSSWFNRDLGIAGRVIYKDFNDSIKEKLVALINNPVTLPQLAIHLDREVNDKGFIFNKQEHLNALAGLEAHLNEGSYLESILKEEIDLKYLLAHDLFLFPLEKARTIGYQNSLISAYRIDSLASVHAALFALLQDLTPSENEIKMIYFSDHEEIGSTTAQGVTSSFFTQILQRILSPYQASQEDYFCLLNRASCLSIDLGHALHPNYPNKHDEQHKIILGAGVVIKHNAQHKYATQALSSFPLQILAENLHLPLQHFVSRNDISCGSTIGPLQANTTGISTVDIGCGQLSMHSCRELMACQDHLDMCQLLTTFLNTSQWPAMSSRTPK